MSYLCDGKVGPPIFARLLSQRPSQKRSVIEYKFTLKQRFDKESTKIGLKDYVLNQKSK